jgi:phi13 family phage major tail protein
MADKPLIGLDQFHYALLNSDTTAGVSYQTPVAVKGAMTASIARNSDVATLPADDGPFVVSETTGEIELTIGVADLSQEDTAALLGHTITAGVLSETPTDISPNLAFGFRALRSSGEYSYMWLYKGKFGKPDMDHETKGDSISFQTPELTGKFAARIYDSKTMVYTRTDADDYTTAIGTAWFSSVYGTTADTTAPTLSSSVPTANATSVPVTSNITLNFSEPILTSSVTASNIVVAQTTSSTTLTASLSVSSGIVTIATASTFTAATTYAVLATAGVKDEAGNGLSGSVTFEFTTT